jgi:hypothetical protein
MFAPRLFSASLLGFVLTAGATLEPAAAQDSLRFEYAVKIICGNPDRPVLAIGRYHTAINIHNPGRRAIVFRRKFALTGPSEGSIAPTAFRLTKLGPDYALEVDCTSRELLDRKFVKGFAVIQSPIEIDVVAVYTGGNVADSLQSMALERVPPRPMLPVPIQ